MCVRESERETKSLSKDRNSDPSPHIIQVHVKDWPPFSPPQAFTRSEMLPRAGLWVTQPIVRSAVVQGGSRDARGHVQMSIQFVLHASDPHARGVIYEPDRSRRESSWAQKLLRWGRRYNRDLIIVDGIVMLLSTKLLFRHQMALHSTTYQKQHQLLWCSDPQELACRTSLSPVYRSGLRPPRVFCWFRPGSLLKQNVSSPNISRVPRRRGNPS